MMERVGIPSAERIAEGSSLKDRVCVAKALKKVREEQKRIRMKVR